MKKVLFITSFNDTVREMNKALSESFKVQVCSASAPSIRRIISVFVPDIILLCAMDMKDELSGLLEFVVGECTNLPVLVIGDKSISEICEKYCVEDRIETLYFPVSNQLMKGQLLSMLGMGELPKPNAEELDKSVRKHILFVDDNGMMLRRMKDMIPDDYRVSLATSGTQALGMIARNKPDLIFLDYEMPGCDGRQTLEMIRSDECMADIPVVFLTGMSEKKYIQAVLELRPAGYLLKPPATDKIMDMIHKILGQVY